MVSKIYQRIHQIMVEERTRQVQLQINGLRGSIQHKKKQRVDLKRMVDPYGASLGDGARARRESEIEEIDLQIIQMETSLQRLQDNYPK
tara:strand:+ start:2093 stop:2359 length:267 start_codon:yes stop_codon:yes gene_type:complete